MEIFGYPMKLIKGNWFMDCISGKIVNLYEFKGKYYMANSKWSIFKVLSSKQPKD